MLRANKYRKDKLCVLVGGPFGTDARYSAASLNLTTQSFTELPDPPLQCDQYACAAAIGQFVYVVGVGNYRSLLVYDAQEKLWSTYDDILSERRRFASVVTVDHRLYISGGGYSSTYDIVETDGSTCTSIPGHNLRMKQK